MVVKQIPVAIRIVCAAALLLSGAASAQKASAQKASAQKASDTGASDSTVEPEPVEEIESPRQSAAERGGNAWWRYLPSVHASVESGFSGQFGADAQPTGIYDQSETGFAFRFLELGLSGQWIGHLGMLAIVSLNENDIVVEKAWAEVSRLPWNLNIRAGLLPSRAGFENERGPTGYRFVDQPLVLGKFFGPLGHHAAGVDLSFDLPLPWQVTIYTAMTAAHGKGMRTWYDQTAVSVDEMRDFGYQIGLNNRFYTGSLAWDLGFVALLGPNDSGRGNQSDIFALSLGLELPADGPAGVSLDFETEWFIRSRQYRADNIGDFGGWAQVLMTVDGDWEMGGRYETTSGATGDPLDVTDTSFRHKVTAQVGWKPYDFGGVRLAGTVDMGGPLSDRSYGLHLFLRAGWRVEP
ncbi:MAG: hypothetical protein ACI9OJ_001730 [Myxococcota bacterium]|jgi:hypothetical protein